MYYTKYCLGTRKEGYMKQLDDNLIYLSIPYIILDPTTFLISFLIIVIATYIWRYYCNCLSDKLTLQRLKKFPNFKDLAAKECINVYLFDGCWKYPQRIGLLMKHYNHKTSKGGCFFMYEISWGQGSQSELKGWVQTTKDSQSCYWEQYQ